jgi:hypothetical protein
MELRDLVDQISGFDGLSPRDKIRLFAWFLHTQRNKEIVFNADMRACFDELHLEDPNVAKYLGRMVDYKDLMRERGGFKLHRSVRTDLDKKYGVHDSVVRVSQLLADLPAKVPDLAERDFLTEALKCYRHEAYRSCIVMTWNLAYSHLLHWILKDPGRLAAFNAAIVKRFPKKTGLQIIRYDDFGDELKESEVIEICGTASLLNSNIKKILNEKLTKRNMAAHPSTVKVVQAQADDAATDLINNVVLALK